MPGNMNKTVLNLCNQRQARGMRRAGNTGKELFVLSQYERVLLQLWHIPLWQSNIIVLPLNPLLILPSYNPRFVDVLVRAVPGLSQARSPLNP